MGRSRRPARACRRRAWGVMRDFNPSMTPCQCLLALLFTIVSRGAVALDNGLGLRPPLGWRSYNAFGGRPTQAIMEATMDAMVDRSRNVSGKPTSLLDLGYKHVGLDGGWNKCFDNHTFHWVSDGRPVWNEQFPDPKAMVAKAHTLGLSPGWCESRYSSVAALKRNT